MRKNPRQIRYTECRNARCKFHDCGCVFLCCNSCCDLDNLAQSNSLSGLVDAYIDSRRQKLKDYLGLYKEPDKTDIDQKKDLKDVARSAAMATCPLNANRVHPHERRVPEKVRQQWAGIVIRNLGKIRSCQTFEELLCNLSELGRNPKCVGVGPLTIYDTALRLSSYLGRRLSCQCVHLYAGARIPGELLARECAPRQEFPVPVRQLEAYEIEDFLCVCSDYTKNFWPKSRISKNVEVVWREVIF